MKGKSEQAKKLPCTKPLMRLSSWLYEALRASFSRGSIEMIENGRLDHRKAI